MAPWDPSHLELAVRLADAGWRRRDGGPFGAVVVLGGEVVGEGNNRVLVDRDPTAHAEVVALRRACASLGAHDALAGATLYASSEPCPLCLSAAHWARVSRVVHGATREDAAAIGFDDARLYDALAGTADHAIALEQGEPSAARRVMAAFAEDPDHVVY